MRIAGMGLALLFVAALVALAWATGDDGPWGKNADETSEGAPKDGP